MNTFYVGLDLGSSNFHHVAFDAAGVIQINREFATSEANLIKAFSDQRVRYSSIWRRASWCPGQRR